jgi:hypothetical protein
MGLGTWGQRWVEANLSLKNLDPTLLMWDVRRGIVPSRFPPGRTVVQFLYPELEPSRRSYWLVVEDGDVDLCFIDPGHEVDLLVRCTLRVMTAIWMGYSSLRAEMPRGCSRWTGARRCGGRCRSGWGCRPSPRWRGPRWPERALALAV